MLDMETKINKAYYEFLIYTGTEPTILLIRQDDYKLLKSELRELMRRYWICDKLISYRGLEIHISDRLKPGTLIVK